MIGVATPLIVEKLARAGTEFAARGIEMTKPETPGYQFVAALLGVDAREEPNLQPDHRLGWWREFWTAMAGRAEAVGDLARSRPDPDQAAPESQDRDDSDEMGGKQDASAATEEANGIRTRPLSSRSPAMQFPAQREEARRTRRGEIASQSLAAQRKARRLERTRQAADRQLAWRVQDIFVARGLTRSGFSIADGYTLRVPEVISVSAGPPVRLDIRILPGQTPDDFADHTQAIAYNLGVAEVRMIPLGLSLIRLELWPTPD